MQLTQYDIWKFAVPAISTIAFALLWIHTSEQRSVSRSCAHSVRVIACLLMAHAGWFYLLCVIFTVSTYWYMVTTAIVFLFGAALDSKVDPGTSDLFGASLLTIVILPLYVVKQLVLGFPDRAQLIAVPEVIPIDLDPPKWKSDTGTVLATLRPMGTVEIAGDQFSASSATGALIEAGANVRVIGHRGKTVLVAELESDGSQTTKTN